MPLERTQSKIANAAEQPSSATPPPSRYETLSLQDSVTSNWLIGALASDAQFRAFAESETASILARDAEDDEKLAGGIKIAVDKGVLTKIDPPAYTKVDVLGKTADEVADEIIAGVGADAETGARRWISFPVPACLAFS